VIYTYALILNDTEIAAVADTDPTTLAAEIITRAKQFASITCTEDPIASSLSPTAPYS